MNTPRIKFEKVIQVFLWIAALGVLVENIVLFRQNRILQGAMAPQISAGTQLQMLSGLSRRMAASCPWASPPWVPSCSSSRFR